MIGEVVRGEGAILVDQEGKDLSMKWIQGIKYLQQLQHCLKISLFDFDQGVRDRATAIEFYDQKGYVTTGKTMEELAEKSIYQKKH